MTMNALFIPLIIGAIVWVGILIEWLGRRRDRQKHEGRT